MRFRMFSDAFGLSLFLSAAFAHEVGAAEGRKQGDAAAQRVSLCVIARRNDEAI